LQFVGGGAESVCLDDIRARSDVFRMDLAYQIWVAEIQLVVAAVDVDTLGIEHRTHRAVDDVDTIRFQEVSEGFHNIDCRFPIADFRLKGLGDVRPIKNRRSKIQNAKSRAKQRGTSKAFEVFGLVFSGFPSCLAGYFTWPQVALTHHAFQRCLYAL